MNCARCGRRLKAHENVLLRHPRSENFDAIELGKGIIVSREGNMHWGYTKDDQVWCPPESRG